MIDCPHPQLCGASQHYPGSGAARACRVRGSLVAALQEVPSPRSNTDQLAGQPIPKVDFGPDDLYHVGMLNPAHKGGTSFEGRGLSVSMHPDDWTRIAKLGGQPTWSFSKSANGFLDLHSLTDEQRAAINRWGEEQGYVRPAEVYRVSWYDSEDDTIYSGLYTDQAEAQAEFEDRDGDYDDDTQLSTESVPVATESFPDPTVRPGTTDPFDILTTLWVGEFTELDGVWWEEDYVPYGMNAPKGVILPHKVADWSTVIVAGHEYAGDEETS